MLSSSLYRDTSNISLGDRRGKSDLARFSLDLSWAREASDSARSRAYPSPPMSGSPPLPSRSNPETSDSTLGSYGSSGQDVYRTPQPPHLQQAEGAGQMGRAYPPDPPPQTSYTPFRLDMPAGQLLYQPQPFMTPQSHPLYSPFPTPEGPSTREGSEYNSPKNQRKAKGHVASACVPCKKAHLRCDAQRPCSRCISNGKEDTCVDVQHKKRGRPRLRDDREARYDNLGPGYAQPPPEPSSRRPVSFYGSGEAPVGTPFGDSLQRAGSYRVLKSQGPSHGSAPIAPQYLEQAMQHPSMYGPIQPAPRMLPSQEPICAYLNTEMQFTKTTQSFSEMVGIPSLISRKLQEVVIPSDVEKVVRLQRSLEDERREKEPNYLPPIYIKFEEDRVIQTVGFGPEELNRIQLDRQEAVTFQGPTGQKPFLIQLGLGKKESTFFVAVVLIPSPPQQQYPSPSPYARETYPREQQYGYHQPQQPYMQQAGPSGYAQPPLGYGGGMNAYQPQGPLGSNVPPPNAQHYAQPQRQEYTQHPPQYQAGPPQSHYQAPQPPSQYQPPQLQPQYQPAPHQTPYQRPQSQPQYQTPPEMHPAQAPRPRDLQLPPIRDQRGESSTDPRRRDDRSGRVDIGGLIEKPDAARRGA